jgi:hypothetical protein
MPLARFLKKRVTGGKKGEGSETRKELMHERKIRRRKA